MMFARGMLFSEFESRKNWIKVEDDYDEEVRWEQDFHSWQILKQ